MSITKEYAGIRWGIAFLFSDSRLNDEEQDVLFREAIMLDLKGKKSSRIRTSALEGKVYRSKSFVMVGSYLSGVQYDAEVDSAEHGSMKLRFVVSEQTSGRYSKN